MALPVGLATVTVTCGPYLDARGTPYKGSITFAPSTPVVWRSTGAVILDGPVVVSLDAAGSGTVVLPATDASGLSVTGFTYTVTFAVKSAAGDKAGILPVLVQLPAAAPAVDLDLLVGVETSTGVVVATPAVVSVAGLSGAVQVADLKAALGLGTAAYQPTTAFDAAGAAAAAQQTAIGAAAGLAIALG